MATFKFHSDNKLKEESKHGRNNKNCSVKQGLLETSENFFMLKLPEDFAKFLRTPFTEHLWTTASELLYVDFNLLISMMEMGKMFFY